MWEEQLTSNLTFSSELFVYLYNITAFWKQKSQENFVMNNKKKKKSKYNVTIDTGNTIILIPFPL